MALRILLAEDFDDCATVTAAVLRNFGHAVRVARDGPNTIDACSVEVPDVVLLAEAVSVIVAHLQVVLAGPDAESIPVEIITAQGMKEAGFDPLKVKEAVVLFAAPTRGTEPDIAAVLRFSEVYSKAAVMSKLVGLEKAVNGNAESGRLTGSEWIS